MYRYLAHSRLKKYIVIASIFVGGFLCFQSTIAAQSPWKADALALSKSGRYLAARYSPDAATNAFASRDGGIWLYDFYDLLSSPVYLVESNHPNPEFVFSPNNAYLAVIDYAGLYVFRTDSGSRVLTLQRRGHAWRTENSNIIVFSPDSRYLRSFDIRQHESSALLQIWDIQTGQLFNAAVTKPIAHFVRMWLTPDWNQILVDDTIFSFDAVEGIGPANAIVPEASYAAYEQDVGAPFSADGTLIALATWDHEVRVFKTDSWTLHASTTLNQKPCEYSKLTFSFGHSRPWLATICPRQEKLFVWNYEIDEVVFQADTVATNSKFTDDGTFLVASNQGDSLRDEQISVWNSEKEFEPISFPGSSPQLHPNGEQMVTIGPDGNVWIWNIRSNKLLVILPAIQS